MSAAAGIHSTHFHVDVLARHLTGKHDALSCRLLPGAEPNGDEEYDEGHVQQTPELPQPVVARRFRGHWVGGWRFAVSHPLIQSDCTGRGYSRPRSVTSERATVVASP